MSTELNSIDVAPSKPGRYNIQFDGVSTMLPLFAEFDGTSWRMNGMAKMFLDMGHKCSYYQDVEPEAANDGLSM